MTTAENWVEALNINPEKLSEWSGQAPPDKPLLVWCLEQGHVPVKEYLEWASKNYGLPILHPNYFHEVFETKNLEAMHSQEPWSAWCFPIGVWDDVTFVACVEPMTETPTGHFAFVLADPTSMAQVWGVEGETDSAPPTPAPILDAPEGINLNATTSFHLNLDALEMATDQESQSSQEAVDPHAMDNAASEKTGFTLSVLIDSAALAAQPQAATLVPSEIEPEVPILDIPELGIGDDFAPPAPVAAASPTPKASAPVAKASPLAVKAPPAPAPVHAAKPVASSAPPPTPKAAPTAMNAQPPPMPVTAKPAAVATPPVPLQTPKKLTGPALEEHEIKLAFDRLKPVYQTTLIMRCKDSILQLYKWDADMKVVNPEKIELNLAYPSFFRIVAKTGQAYHGYVVDSPVHQDFFRALQLKGTPACVTAIALKVNGALWGVLVAFGGESAQGADALQRCQNVADKLVAAMEPTWASAA